MRVCFEKEIDGRIREEHPLVLGQLLSGGCLGREKGGQSDLIGGQEPD